jgi:hypothetical protein
VHKQYELLARRYPCALKASIPAHCFGKRIGSGTREYRHANQSDLQAWAEGDLSERARGRAHQIAQDGDLRINAPRGFFTVGGEHVQTTGNQNRRQQDRRLPLPGALLTRKWKGRTVLVEVLAKGFRYENRQYSSLSSIATAITGTRWNGLAFFGLTRSARRERKEQSRAKK